MSINASRSTETHKITAIDVIAKVAKAQIEQKFGSVSNAITKMCCLKPKNEGGLSINAKDSTETKV